MKKAVLNYWVDVVAGLAMLVCAVTGIVRLFPDATSLAGGSATILGVSSALWSGVHDWSGVVMAAGVALHALLHVRWFVRMTGKIARGETGSAGGHRRARPGGAGRAPAPVAAGAHSAATPEGDVAASLVRLDTLGARRGGEPDDVERQDDAPRISRKAFLAGAAAVGAAALLAGAGIVRSGDPETAVAAGGVSSGAASADAAAGTSSTASSTSASSTSASSSVGGSGTSDAATTASARVAVDVGACSGCGHCLQACPHGVFTLDGGRAVASDADACTLCGRCVQVCRPQAITLNG